MRTQFYNNLLLFFAVSLSSSYGVSAELSELQIFHRCIAHIANSVPALNLPERQAVVNGSRTGVDACMDVLQKAELTASGNTRIPNTNDSLALSITRTFHNLHASWFSQKTFKSIEADSCLDESMGDIIDPSTPALYFTNALLKPNTNYSSIVSGDNGLISIRTDNNPNMGAYTNRVMRLVTNSSTRSDTETIVDWGVKRLAPRGDLFGIETPTPYLAPPLRTERLGFTNGATDYSVVDHNLDILSSHGGGLLGTQAYMQLNFIRGGNASNPGAGETDGAVRVSRKWSQAVFNDLLCRSLPVVRSTDSSPYIVPDSSIPFRNGASCVQCHVSMDQMAYSTRNYRYAANATCNLYGSNPRIGGKFTYRQPSSEPTEGDNWLSEPDEDFYRRPPRGKLFYRSTEGNLVNREISDLEGIGQALLQEDDIYICAAKRYFKFFTGVEANIDDINDPLSPVNLSAKETEIRNQVITLGKSLRTHQSLKTLIRQIISSQTYRDSSYLSGGQ